MSSAAPWYQPKLGWRRLEILVRAHTMLNTFLYTSFFLPVFFFFQAFLTHNTFFTLQKSHGTRQTKNINKVTLFSPNNDIIVFIYSQLSEIGYIFFFLGHLTLSHGT